MQFALRPLFLFLLLLFSQKIHCQTDAVLMNQTAKTPIAFANIVFDDEKSGTITNLNGEFSLPETSGDSVTISCAGYHAKTISTKHIADNSILLLSSKTITLNEVNRYPGDNPALTIMGKVVENTSQNNPNLYTNYSCILYHKMTYNMEVPDSVSPSDSLAQEIIRHNEDNYFLLMESILQKQHLAPDKNKEKLISGRVSGFKDPALASLPSQIQPFVFYSKYIKVMDVEYLNPLSKRGLKHYIFILQDTIIEKGDSLFYITFHPRKTSGIKALKGSFHVHKKTSGIKYIKASSALPSAPFKLDINQNFELIDGHQWFPSELESKLLIRSTADLNPVPYPLAARTKSLVTAVDLNPGLKHGDFSSVAFEDRRAADTSGIKLHRYEPLTANDSATYLLIDSIEQANNRDNIIRLQKEIINGFLPVGPLRLDLKHLIGYNKFEGLKLGLGLWTSREITGNISTGGYYKHAFKTHDNNYGAGIKWSPSPISQAIASISYAHEMSTTGSFSFHRGNIITPEDLFKSFAVSVMDKESRIGSSLQTRFWGPMSGKLFFTYSEVEPVRTYNFNNHATEPESPFTDHEFGLKLRWAYKESQSNPASGVPPKKSSGPKIWINLISGIQSPANRTIRYAKIETQLEKTFHTGPAAQTTIRITGGRINGNVTSPNLYSFFGTYEPLSIEVPYMFATMEPGEFAADQFALAFLTHKIPLFQNNEGAFKPEINIMTRAGWADLTMEDNQAFKTFNRGFYESGILFDNLMKVLFLKYGVAIHYRYGPYQQEKEIDNWSFRLGVNFAF